MSRWLLRAAACAALVAGSEFRTATAQDYAPGVSPLAASLTGGSLVDRRVAATPVANGGMPSAAAPGFNAQAGYVKLDAPMYPSPRPNIPIWTGSTYITNQAFAPHEMLYPHTYRAMYPPFYHRVKGKYLWTPFGMRTHEQWQLQGTKVLVKYRSQWPHFGGPHKPVISKWGGPWD